eukprot:1919904-Rhodomonas_salina.2
MPATVRLVSSSASRAVHLRVSINVKSAATAEDRRTLICSTKRKAFMFQSWTSADMDDSRRCTSSSSADRIQVRSRLSEKIEAANSRICCARA